MMGEEEEVYKEELYLNDDHHFNMSPTQLRMLSYNIMADVRNKYDPCGLLKVFQFIQPIL